jgi:hypothetical protein
MEAHTPTKLVLRIVDMASGNAPRDRASEVLDPAVTIHVDSAVHRGIENWYKWMHLIRNCGRIRGLRMVPCVLAPDAQDPCSVNLILRWTGIRKGERLPRTTSETYYLRFRVEGNRIVEIWSRKANYVFIFGRWFRSAIVYRLYLGWAVLYFAALSLRGIDYRLDRGAA